MAEFSLTNVSNLFKTKFGKLSDNTYNSANVLLARVKKSFTFTGKRMEFPVPLSFAGGVGSGSIPTANFQNVEDVVLTAKRVYARVQIEREAIKAASNDEGAFVRMTKHTVQRGVESWMRNMSRILFGEGDGSLATGDNSTNVSGAGTSGDPFIVVLATDQKDANVEERDFWNFESETTNLEVTEYDEVTNTVKLVGTSAGLSSKSGGSPVTGAEQFFMQGSSGNDPEGLKSALDASSGTLYTVPVQRRWQATQKAAGGSGITPDLLNEVMLEVERKSGKVPNLILMSFIQLRKILNLLEDQKQYIVEPRSAELKGKISFKGVEFMSTAGPIPMFAERFVEDDRVYLLNDNWIEIFHRPDFGWFDDDGTVFLRLADTDSFEARYGGYLEMFVTPTFQGVITGLST